MKMTQNILTTFALQHLYCSEPLCAAVLHRKLQRNCCRRRARGGEVVHISTSLAQELGIETELAGAGVINRELVAVRQDHA